MGLCIRQLRELGYSGPFVASLGFILTDDAIATAGEATRDGFIINFAFASDTGALAFRDRYRRRFGEDPAPNAVIDYGTLYLLSKALAAVGDDPGDLVTYLRQLGQTELPTGMVTISPNGDIVTPVEVVPVPASGPLQLWVDDPG
jgi:ABC-type branched-subunit amino acid transport system substrate-binding protein